jgi:hypothetical protein
MCANAENSAQKSGIFLFLLMVVYRFCTVQHFALSLAIDVSFEYLFYYFIWQRKLIREPRVFGIYWIISRILSVRIPP